MPGPSWQQKSRRDTRDLDVHASEAWAGQCDRATARSGRRRGGSDWVPASIQEGTPELGLAASRITRKKSGQTLCSELGT